MEYFGKIMKDWRKPGRPKAGLHTSPAWRSAKRAGRLGEEGVSVKRAEGPRPCLNSGIRHHQKWVSRAVERAPWKSKHSRMPQSLSNIVVHTVFSTRNRFPWLKGEVRPILHAYISNVTRNLGCECYRVGGVDDHVHLAIRLSRTLAVCKMVEEIKTASCKWLKKQESNLSGFSWQRGYAALSIDPEGIQALCGYIETQADHHRKFSYQDEYRALLKESGIEFDEQYMWD
jgi:putative transposase